MEMVGVSGRFSSGDAVFDLDLKITCARMTWP
jgi:hypothetical protein